MLLDECSIVVSVALTFKGFDVLFVIPEASIVPTYYLGTFVYARTENR